jgi:hypothetical protein
VYGGLVMRMIASLAVLSARFWRLGAAFITLKSIQSRSSFLL